MTSKTRGFELFAIGGVRVAIDPSWLVIVLLVLWTLSAGYFPQAYPDQAATAYWAVGAVATLFFFASVVAHELAHALVANRLGQEVRRITLFIFGGVAHLSRESRSPRTELTIAAVGPLASLLLGGAYWFVAWLLADLGTPSLWVGMVRYLAGVNVALAAFNLLPGLPLDGGRVLRGLLWLRSGDLRTATARAADWGTRIGLGLMVLGALQVIAGGGLVGAWPILIGMFLRGAAQASYETVVVDQMLGSTCVRDLMVPDSPTVVPGDLSVAHAVEDYFLRYGYGGFPVADDGRIVGLVSLAEVKRCPREERGARSVREVMRPASEVQVSAHETVAEALRRMVESGNGRLLVADRGRVIGLITHSGITRFVQIRTALDEPTR